MSHFKEELYIKSYEIDHNGHYRASSFLQQAQEAANRDADKQMFGYDQLMERGVAWVLSRIHVKVIESPKWRDQLTMESWHKGGDALFGYRDFVMSNKSGEAAILATSSWLVIDLNSRRVQRLNRVLDNQFEKKSDRDAIEEPAARLSSPKEMTLLSTHRVGPSDLDINGHTNNARYLEWGLDALPIEITKELQIKEFWLNFNQETLLGQEIELYYNESALPSNEKSSTLPKTLFIEGRREQSSIFQLKIVGSW